MLCNSDHVRFDLNWACNRRQTCVFCFIFNSLFLYYLFFFLEKISFVCACVCVSVSVCVYRHVYTCDEFAQRLTIVESRSRKNVLKTLVSTSFFVLLCIIFLLVFFLLDLFSYLIGEGSVIIRTRDVDTRFSFVICSLVLYRQKYSFFIHFCCCCSFPFSVKCNTAPRACSLSYVYTRIYRICIYRIYIICF